MIWYISFKRPDITLHGNDRVKIYLMVWLWVEGPFDLFMITWNLIKNTFTTCCCFMWNFSSKVNAWTRHIVVLLLLLLLWNDENLWKLFAYHLMFCSQGISWSVRRQKKNIIKFNFRSPGVDSRLCWWVLTSFAYKAAQQLRWPQLTWKTFDAKEAKLMKTEKSNQKQPINCHDLLQNFRQS